jgi:hypothetical protein
MAASRKKKSASRKSPSRKSSSARPSHKRESHSRSQPTRRWSQHVTETSDALDLEGGVFKKGEPKAIARSLKRSAEQSHRRKANPYRSAMSMLVFYINRAGHNLSTARRRKLEQAKDELRALYDKPRKG